MRAVRRADYTPSTCLIEHTELHFDLHAGHAIVRARLSMRRQPGSAAGSPLTLQGRALELLELRVGGHPLGADAYELGAEWLSFAMPAEEAFVVETRVRITPQTNTTLMGLYQSGNLLCTQCEPEGFRRITWYLDRPDVLSRFTVSIEADQARYPVLLSNGNPVERTALTGGRHRVVWQDPFPKPAYLFALVAGDLARIEDRFVTCSGRNVALQIFAAPAEAGRLTHAMHSLKHAMRWDEERYGREYDLDIFMIVAVADFNMGAMENKGLNIFNAAALLASPDTATDAAYQRVEAIVAHEYFHNWSGNRVTCRDWFQLSLKEGFTVFRDSQFSADMNSATLKRIQDVARLRSFQFAEDAGPMAHPVRPDSYIEIANFYSMTVYEKGAEVLRMIACLVGPEGFRKGCDLYFDRHDGQAVTCDDFVRAIEDANGISLEQFKRWYSQAGTPRVTVSAEHDAASGEFHLHFTQRCPATPGQAEKKPFVIPVELSLFDTAGHEIPLPGTSAEPVASQVFVLDQARQTLSFSGVHARPVPSLLRGFSAPVVLEYAYSREELALLMRHETDGFNRWEAGQRLAVDVLLALVAAQAESKEMVLDEVLLAALGDVLGNTGLDPALCAEMLVLPSELYLGGLVECTDIEAIHAAREFARARIAAALAPLMWHRYRALRAVSAASAYSPEGEHSARRSLQGVLLNYLALEAGPEVLAACVAQYRSCDNLTERLSALGALLNAPTEAAPFAESRNALLDDFATRYRDVPQVMDSWFAIQAGCSRDGALERVRQLAGDPAFTLRNPNRARALIGAFCQNLAGFHRRDGQGYRFLAEQVLAANALNPQLAAGLVRPLTQWRKYDAARQAQLLACLGSLKDSAELSRDVFEIVSKSLPSTWAARQPESVFQHGSDA